MAQEPNGTAHALRLFIVNHFRLARSHQFGDEDSLLTNGLIDSLGVIELVEFIENRFAITLTDEEMVADHFDSISRLAAFVESKVTAAASRASPVDDDKGGAAA